MISQNLRLKLRYILWPFLRLLVLSSGVVAAICIAILHWQPTFKLPNDEGTYFGTLAVTFAVPWLLRGTFLLVRDTSHKRTGASFLVFIVAMLTVGFAVGTIPRYVIAKLGRLQPLPALASLPHYPEAPYYRARQVLLDTANKSFYPSTFEAGKSSYRVFELLVACPVVRNTLPPPAPGKAAVWLAFSYYDRLDQPGFRDDYWASYQQFITAKQLVFRGNFQRPCYYFERLPDDEWLGQPENVTRTGIRPPYGNGVSPVILRPVYTPFTERTAGITPLLVWSQCVGISLFCLLSLILPLDEGRRQQLLAAQASSSY